MKKRIAAFVFAFVVLVSCFAIPTFADDITEFYYIRSSSYFDFLRNNYNDVNYWTVLEFSPSPDIALRFPDQPSSFSVDRDFVFYESDYSVVSFYYPEGDYEEYLADVMVGALPDNKLQIIVSPYVNGTFSGDDFDIIYDYSLGYWYRSTDNSRVVNVTITTYIKENLTVNVQPTIRPDETNGYAPDFVTMLGIEISYPFISNIDKEYWKGIGYDHGYVNGSNSGYADGYNVGYEEGKFDGATEGTTGWMNFKNLIFTIFDAPFYILTTAFNFDIFGINIAGTLIGIISLALIVFILKIIIVRLF